MIFSRQGKIHIEGSKLEVIFEFDEILRIMIANHPEVVQASVLAHSDELQSAKIDEEKFMVVEHLIDEKIKMHMNGGVHLDDDSML